MNFTRWLQLYDEFCKDADLSDWLFCKLFETATTFDDWRNIFYRSQFGSLNEERALYKAAICAETFGQWLWIYEELDDRPVRGGNLVRIFFTANRRIVELAESPTDATWTKNANSLDAISIARWERLFNKSEFNVRAGKSIVYIRNRMRERKAQKVEEMGTAFSPLKI